MILCQQNKKPLKLLNLFNRRIFESSANPIASQLNYIIQKLEKYIFKYKDDLNVEPNPEAACQSMLSKIEILKFQLTCYVAQLSLSLQLFLTKNDLIRGNEKLKK